MELLPDFQLDVGYRFNAHAAAAREFSAQFVGTSAFATAWLSQKDYRCAASVPNDSGRFDEADYAARSSEHMFLPNCGRDYIGRVHSILQPEYRCVIAYKRFYSREGIR
jgi:hypothetical protein